MYIAESSTGGIWIRIVGIILLTCLVGLLFVSYGPQEFVEKKCGDCESSYLVVAENFASGKGWVDTQGNYAIDRGPLHTLVLSGVLYASASANLAFEKALVGFNILLFASCTVLIYLSIGATWGYSRYSPLALLFWVFCPYALWFLPQAYSGNTQVFFICLTNFIWLRFANRVDCSSEARFKCSWYILGLICGLSALAGPIAIGLPGVYFLGTLFCWGWKRVLLKYKMLFLLVLGFASAIAPWSLSVYRNTDQFVILTNGVLARNSLVNGFTFATRGLEYRKPVALPSDVRKMMKEIDNKLFAAAQKESLTALGVMKIIKGEAKQQPIIFLKFLGIKASRGWYGTDSHSAENLARLISSVYLGCVLLIIVFLRKKKSIQKCSVLNLLALISGYFWVMSLIFEPLVRYMVPAFGSVPILIAGLFMGSLATKNETSIRARYHG